MWRFPVSGIFIVHIFIFVSWRTCESNFISIKFKLSSHDTRGHLPHFWKSTGFCPPLPHQNASDFDLGHDMQLNLAYIGALPFGAIRQVRVHWLFELVNVDELTSQGPCYDFSLLDEFVSLLFINGLVPGFELMGNPSGIYSDFENSTQVFWWKDLVKQTAQRYVDKYGIAFVKDWNFETWNEPNNHDFDNLSVSIQGLLNYYDACSEGLKAVDASIKLGGLGDGGRDLLALDIGMYSQPFFNHIIRGKNFFTGEIGVRLDFMAFHAKGEGHGSLILKKETLIMQKIESLFPQLLNKAFYNDEADPLVGWSKSETWRANALYPAAVAKVIAQHQNMVISNGQHIIRNYTLLSNDNGFLSYHPHQFTQRTLMARFQINNTSPNYVTFIRKPIYSIMALLALLGENQIHVDATKGSGFIMANDSNVGALASLHQLTLSHLTSDCWQMTLLIYKSTDPLQNTKPDNDVALNVTWYIDPPTNVTDLKMRVYHIYNWDESPFDIWTKKYHSVPFPSLDQLKQIRKHEDPISELYDIPAKRGPLPMPSTLKLKDPHVLLMHLCGKAHVAPEKVVGVRFINVTHGQVVVIWEDALIATRCLLTYEVELSTTAITGPYRRVNNYNSIITLFLFETDSEAKVRGYYRIRAMDYWSRGGKYSEPLHYPVDNKS